MVPHSVLIRQGILALFLLGLVQSMCLGQSPKPLWKAGVARTAITPKETMWMAGYAARNHPAEGTLHELMAKALVLEDQNGQRVVMISTDLVGVPQKISEHIKTRLQEKFGLTKAQILLNSSHTHSGPVLELSLIHI